VCECVGVPLCTCVLMCVCGLMYVCTWIRVGPAPAVYLSTHFCSTPPRIGQWPYQSHST